MKIWKVATGGRSWLWIDRHNYSHKMIKRMVIRHLYVDDIVAGVEYEVPDDLTITEIEPDPTYHPLFDHSPNHQTKKCEMSIVQVEI